MASSFRTSTWDPVVIIAQIVALQSVFYLAISILLWIATVLSGTEMTLDLLFTDQTFGFDTVLGWTLGLVWFVNAVITILPLVFIVQRAKLMLDFVLTLHAIHLLLVWVHLGYFPTTGAWWLVQVMDIMVMTLGGEWACMQYEMQPILMGGKRIASAQDNTDNAAPSSSRSNANTKRKQSDHGMEEGPLMTAVGLAKNALMSGSQDNRKKNASHEGYEVIPLSNVNVIDHQASSSSTNASTSH